MRVALAGTAIRRVRVEVEGRPEIPSGITSALRVSGGIASGAIEVPASRGSTVTVRGYDAMGTETHAAAQTMDFAPGARVRLAISLVPSDESRDRSADREDWVVRVAPALSELTIGGQIQLLTSVFTARGDTVGGAARFVDWAVLPRSVVKVDRDGLVTALDSGVVDVVAQYGGGVGTARVRVSLGTTAAGCPASLTQLAADRINKERRAMGLRPLGIDTRLAAAARWHAADVAGAGFLGHRGSGGATMRSRLARAGFPWRSAAENVAGGQDSAEHVVRSWMESPGHRANILGADFQQVGLAYSVGVGTKYSR